MKQIAVFTLGCKVNQYDSDGLVFKLKALGYEVSEAFEPAEIFVINTCAVTNEAERKSRQAVSRARKLNPSCRIFVCGCASQNNSMQFSEKENVVFVSGTAGKNDLIPKIQQLLQDGKCEFSSCSNEIPAIFEDTQFAVSPRTRHFIKVQDGCNNFCSYCLIPYLRGRCRSRKTESIICELDSVCDDVKEVVLTGINLSAYGTDNQSSLTELLKALEKYDFRVRLGSLEANVITREFLDETKRLKNFCDHFHLSLQSGDDQVLKTMNRHYNTAEYFEKVELIRKYYPSAAITTDIIVGFPTETDEAFENCKAFARKVGFADIHAFSFSKRNGTVAYKMKGLNPETVDKRAKELAVVKQELKTAYNLQFIGKPLEVLFETEEDGFAVGHTKNYITVYKKIDRNKTLADYRNTLGNIVPTELFGEGLK